MAKRIFGVDSLSLTKILTSCALSYSSQNNFNKALELILDCLKIQNNNFNHKLNMENKKALEKTFNLVSKIYFNIDKIKSKEYKLKYLNMLQRFYDNKDHLDISKVLFELGIILENTDINQSFHYHSMCFEMRKRLCKKDNPLFLKSKRVIDDFSTKNVILTHNNSNLLVNIGKACLKNKDFKKAYAYFLQAFDVLKANENSHLDDKADCLCLIGVALTNAGNDQKALEYKFECLRLLQMFNDGKYSTKENINIRITKTLFSIAVSYSKLGEFSMSLEYDLKCLHLREKIYKTDDSELANSLFGVGSSYSNLGMHAEALEYKLKGLEMCKRLYNSENHTETAEALHSVALT